MKVFPATVETARVVMQNMRDVDRRDAFALQHRDDVEYLLAMALIPGTTVAWTLHADDGTPIALIGGYEKHPGVAFGFLLATPQLRSIRKSLVRWVKRMIVLAVKTYDLHRIETVCPVDRVEAQRWLTHLGLECEGLKRQYGKHREDYFVYAWLREPGVTNSQDPAKFAGADGISVGVRRADLDHHDKGNP